MSARTVIADALPGRAAALSHPARPLRGLAWWLWPHLLSLDAPLVAIAWQYWWARSTGVRLQWSCAAILGSGVWLIYVADRLVDAVSPARRGHTTARHAFYRQAGRFMWPASGLILVVLVGYAPWSLPSRQFVPGVGLLAVAGGYFWLIHQWASDGWSRLVPKEAVVAAIFAAGTIFFICGHAGSFRPELMAALVLFGCLCFFNCALITKWEQNPPDLQDPSSLLNAFPFLTARLGAGCLILAAVAAIATAGMWQDATFLPVIFSGLLLAGLDRHKNRFSIDALRVLADVALLTPWLCGTCCPVGH